DSRSGSDTSRVKPAGVIHWVAAHAAEPVQMRLYDRLFRVRDPKGASLMDDLNPASLVTASGFLEPAAATGEQSHFQFERVGYFHRDPVLPRTFNRVVSLRDSWRPRQASAGSRKTP
ncbi:MAG: glutamine--tRNA ligase, partial [Gammaproteobacteria bacterium]|nr:glutamine--tRNA ligase [Gammaproteobacteria bacterium]